MTVLQWDAQSERYYETGTQKGVLYVQNNDGTYGNGVAWNGLIGVTENPSGAEETALYANDHKYASLRSTEIEEGSISAYTYPDEWMACDGSKSIVPGAYIGQQARKAFGLTWRTIVGNDVELDDYGYKLHIISGATASPSEKAYASVNDSPEAIEFSWDFTCSPTEVGTISDDYKPTASITIDSTKADLNLVKAIENALYGTTNTEPHLVTPDQIIDASANATYALTTDTQIIPRKTYYTREGEEEGSYTYTPVANPVVTAISTYYEATYNFAA